VGSNAWMLYAVLGSSLLPGIVIFLLDESSKRLRTTLNMLGAVVKLVLVGVMLIGVTTGETYEASLPFLPGLDLTLEADPLALLFVTLSAFLWLVTTIYAVAYLEGSPHRSRFFGFFSLVVTSTVGVALAGDLLTFLVFYELLTLSTFPLVVHRGTPDALKAGRIYLSYVFFGGILLLAGTVWTYAITGTVDFTAKGFLAAHAAGNEGAMVIVFSLLIGGLGVKAALVPLHGWLPNAMAAPAPVSALLHAVAVVKAGAFGIIRVVYEVFGIEFAAAMGLTTPLAIMAAITIIYGSVRAVYQDDLKRRLAFSTVSQVSYIALGVAVVGPIATIGGLVHLVHQGLMKITLFFCAGNLAETLGVKKVSQMNGAGKRMPLSMAAFTVGALGMIGIPPVAGFVSKWFLGLGAVESGQKWVLVVLLVSSLLNAIYFLPVLYRIWFLPAAAAWPKEVNFGRAETHLGLLLPPLITAVFSVAAGLLASVLFSPQTWAKLVAGQEF